MKDEVLYRYLYGEATEKEKMEVLEWLDADPKNHPIELSKIHYVCTALEYHRPAEQEMKGAYGGTKWRIMRIVSGVAASVAVLVGVWFLSDLNTQKNISQRTESVEVPAGQYFSIRLEDGSKVWLNAGTKLEYPVVFEKGVRNVKLSGEAMFEVEHDAKRPFIVETFSSRIEVLGTKFNVIADADQQLFVTTLVEGSVRVTDLNDPASTFDMKPYDVVQLLGGHLYKTNTTDFKDLCWTEGLIRIKKMPFKDLMARFEKAYNVKIDVERQTMPEIRVKSGEIRISDGVDYALQVLQQVSDFTYYRNEEMNVIVIK